MPVDISNELNTIKSTQLGRTMRPALHDAISKQNKELNRSSALIDEFIKNAQQVAPQNAEIIAARVDNTSNMPIVYDTLGERLDKMKEDSKNKVADLKADLEQTNAQLSTVREEVYDFGFVRSGRIKLPDDFQTVPFSIFKKQDKAYYCDATPNNIFNWSKATQIYIDCNSTLSSGLGTDAKNAIRLSIFLNNVRSNLYSNQSSFVINLLNNVVAMSDVFNLTDEGINLLIRSKAINGFSWVSRFKRPTVENETSAWTSTDGIYKTTQNNNHECIDIVNIVNCDEYGQMPKPYIKVESLAECQNTKGTFYQNETDKEVWCNPHTGHNINKCMPLVNTKVIRINMTTENTVMFENVGFCMGATEFRPKNLNAKLYFFNCKFFRNYNDAFAIQGLYRCFLISCIASYGGKDGFNYHADSKDCFAVEINCASYGNGMYKFSNGNQTTHSNNGSTAHNGMNMLRVGCSYWLNQGPSVADVNNCYSITYGCRVYDQLESHTGTRAGYEYYDTDNTNRPNIVNKYVIDCMATGSGMDYGVSGTEDTVIIGFDGLKKYKGNPQIAKFSEVM